MIRCGFYERCVTPPIGSEIPGYWCRRPSTGILDELYVKAFVTDDGEKQTALIVADAVEFLHKHCEAILKRVEEMSGIPADRISVSGNHSHYGVPCGDPPGTGALEDEPFMDVFCRVAADCVYMAKQRLQDSEMTFGSGWVEGIAYCRDQVLENGIVCTNANASRPVVRPYSDTDPQLGVLFVRNGEGKPMGALICYSLHQDCIGGAQFSGDFSSELSRQLKAKYGPEFVSIYTAGAAGDINHVDRMEGLKRPYTERGQILAAETIRVIEEASAPVVGEKVDGKRVILKLRNRRATQEEKELAYDIAVNGNKRPERPVGSGMSKLLLIYEEEMEASGQVEEDVPVQVSMVGDTFIVAMPGEPYHVFGKAIKDGCPTGKCIISTLSHGMYGYMPTPELLGTCIYPGQLCVGSRFEGEAGNKIVKAALDAMAAMLAK